MLQRLILTESQAQILKGEAIINTLYSLITDYNFSYDKKACKELINKINNLK